MIRFHVVALLLAAFVTACSANLVGGRAQSDPGPPVLPARPKELRIAGFDPCSALSPAQVTSLGVKFYRREVPLELNGPGCTWSHYADEPIQSYSLDINTRGGVELAFGQPNLHVVTVAGFGGVETPGQFSSGEDNCIVNVDVAPGQAVSVGYFYNGDMPMTHQIACEKARNAAELAMQTIVAKLGG